MLTQLRLRQREAFTYATIVTDTSATKAERRAAVQSPNRMVSPLLFAI